MIEPHLRRLWDAVATLRREGETAREYVERRRRERE